MNSLLLKAEEIGEKLRAIALYLGGLRISAEIAFMFSQKTWIFRKSEGRRVGVQFPFCFTSDLLSRFSHQLILTFLVCE